MDCNLCLFLGAMTRMTDLQTRCLWLKEESRVPPSGSHSRWALESTFRPPKVKGLAGFVFFLWSPILAKGFLGFLFTEMVSIPNVALPSASAQIGLPAIIEARKVLIQTQITKPKKLAWSELIIRRLMTLFLLPSRTEFLPFRDSLDLGSAQIKIKLINRRSQLTGKTNTQSRGMVMMPFSTYFQHKSITCSDYLIISG